MTLTGTINADWFRKHGAHGVLSDERLRAWRDYLEKRLLEELQLDANFAIGDRTMFHFIIPSTKHTIVEIEAFARRALDTFLDKEAR